MKTKTKKTVIETTRIEISIPDVIKLLRAKFPDIPDSAHISHIESDDGDDVVGIHVEYELVK